MQDSEVLNREKHPRYRGKRFYCDCCDYHFEIGDNMIVDKDGYIFCSPSDADILSGKNCQAIWGRKHQIELRSFEVMAYVGHNT